MELLQLRYFLVAAKHEHITRAAKELHISQSTLSITINRLETELGTSLFSHSGRNVRLNDAGRLVYKYAQTITNQLSDMQNELRRLNGEKDSTIVIASSSTRFVPTAALAFLEEHDHVKIKHSREDVATIKAKLLAHEIDLAISCPPVKGENIETKIMGVEEVKAVVSVDHPLAKQSSVRLADLAKEELLALSTEYSYRNMLDELFAREGITPNYVFEGGQATLIEMMRLRRGVSLIPTPLSREMPGREAFVEIPICDPTTYRTIAVSWMKDRKLNEPTQQFAQFIVDYHRRMFIE
jgi:DNA-binding transcriptional LysR family regulator